MSNADPCTMFSRMDVVYDTYIAGYVGHELRSCDEIMSCIVPHDSARLGSDLLSRRMAPPPEKLSNSLSVPIGNYIGNSIGFSHMNRVTAQPEDASCPRSPFHRRGGGCHQNTCLRIFFWWNITQVHG
jgi:hypothetical protein